MTKNLVEKKFIDNLRGIPFNRNHVKDVLGNIGINKEVSGTLGEEEDCPAKHICEYKTDLCTNQRYEGCNFYEEKLTRLRNNLIFYGRLI